MKISNINPLACNPKKYQNINFSSTKQGGVRYISYYFSPTNVSFGQKFNLSQLINSGYEIAEINQAGKLSNKGQYIILRAPKDLIALSKTENAFGKKLCLEQI